MPSLGDVIAANVRAERARQRLTQAELAERLGWGVGTLGDLEAGRRKVAADDIPALCEALGLPFRRLVDRAEPADLQRLRLREGLED